MFLLLQRLLKQFNVFFFIEFFIILIIFSLIFFFTCDDDDFYGLDKQQYKTETNRFILLFYYCFITGSTVGYGDIHPITIKSRSIASVLIIISLMTIFNIFK